MNNRLLSSIALYDAMHGFLQGIWMRTETLEEKLYQQLVGICYEPLFQVFLDVRKSCDSLYRKKLHGDNERIGPRA